MRISSRHFAEDLRAGMEYQLREDGLWMSYSTSLPGKESKTGRSQMPEKILKHLQGNHELFSLTLPADYLMTVNDYELRQSDCLTLLTKKMIFESPPVSHSSTKVLI